MPTQNVRLRNIVCILTPTLHAQRDTQPVAGSVRAEECRGMAEEEEMERQKGTEGDQIEVPHNAPVPRSILDNCIDPLLHSLATPSQAKSPSDKSPPGNNRPEQNSARKYADMPWKKHFPRT